jgi:hypothetical protein
VWHMLMINMMQCIWPAACMVLPCVIGRLLDDRCGLTHFLGLRFCSTGFEPIALLLQAASCLVDAPAAVSLTQHSYCREPILS